MSIRDIKDPAAVKQALEEFDRLGRGEFLRKYGFGESNDWFIFHDGRMYDAKAVLGAAHAHAGLGLLSQHAAGHRTLLYWPPGNRRATADGMPPPGQVPQKMARCAGAVWCAP